MSHYLDHNATTAVRPEARAAIEDVLSMTGNGSSVHGPGRKARALIERSREMVAALVNADPDNVTFTSGGTEANNQAMLGADAQRVLVSAIEHPAVLSVCESAEIIPVTQDGVVDLAQLKSMLGEDASDTLVCVMFANNETGVIQPIVEVAEIVHAAGARLHCDAVQAPGKVAIDVRTLGVDSLALSGHKMGAPAGIGALITGRCGKAPASLMSGGGQEYFRRAGTENLMGIAAMGAAAAAIVEHGAAEAAAMAVLKDVLEENLPDGSLIAGQPVARLPNTTNIIRVGLEAETQVMSLDLRGVAVSAGAACSSGKVKKSAVLSAMGYGDSEAGSAIRVSLGWNSTQEDVDAFIGAYTKLVGQQSAAA